MTSLFLSIKFSFFFNFGGNILIKNTICVIWKLIFSRFIFQNTNIYIYHLYTYKYNSELHIQIVIYYRINCPNGYEGTYPNILWIYITNCKYFGNYLLHINEKLMNVDQKL